MSQIVSSHPTAKQKNTELAQIKKFFSTRKWFVWLSFLLILATYWAKIVFLNYSIDTEEFMLYAKKSGFIQWLEIGRYGLFLLKKFVTGYTIHLRLINLTTYLFLFLTVLLLGYIFYRVSGTMSTIELLIIPILFSTSAILLEQFNFILQSVEVSFSYFLVFLAVYLCYLATTNKKITMYISSGLCAIVSFSVYPSNYLAFIVLSIMLIMILIANQQSILRLSDYIRCLLPYAITFVSSFILNQVLFSLALSFYQTSKDNYVGASILWGKLPLIKVFAHMAIAVKDVYILPKNNCFSYATTIGLCILFYLLMTWTTNKGWLWLSAIALVVASNATIIVLGQLGPVRSMAPIFPLFTAFLFLFSYHYLTIPKKKMMVLAIILLVGGLQIKRTNQYAIQEEKIFREEIAYVDKLVTELKRRGIKDLGSYQIAAIGSKRFPVKGAYYQGDALGASFFNWDNPSPINSSGRIQTFLNSLGYPVQRIDVQTYQTIVTAEKNQPMKPDTIAIQGTTIILKLDE